MTVKCSYCENECQMLNVRHETVARCADCGSVHRDYDGTWLTDRDAVVRLMREIEQLKRAFSTMARGVQVLGRRRMR